MEPSATPDQSKRRVSRRRARRLATTLTVLLVLVLAGYTAAIALATLPSPTAQLSVEATQQFDADTAPAQTAADAQAGPTAVGWLHNEDVWTNSEAAAPIASLTKLITVLVTLEAEPLDPGVDGPVHVWTKADQELQDEYISRNGIAFPIPVGTEVTTRQMLMLALIPSANDFAAAYAYSVFGDNDSFIAAVDAWKKKYSLNSLVVEEPTGMSEHNAASPADVLRVSRMALQNPTVAEIVAMPEAELPWGIGLVESTNKLHGLIPGTVGVKTGSTDVAGYNLASAQISNTSGRDLVKLSVVLSRESEEGRIDSSIAVLNALEAGPQAITFVTDVEPVGTVTTVDDIEIPLVAQGEASTVLVPGESATREVELAEVGEGAAGQNAGVIRVDSPLGAGEVPIVTTDKIVEPDFWWRWTHPAKVFGW